MTGQTANASRNRRPNSNSGALIVGSQPSSTPGFSKRKRGTTTLSQIDGTGPWESMSKRQQSKDSDYSSELKIEDAIEDETLALTVLVSAADMADERDNYDYHHEIAISNDNNDKLHQPIARTFRLNLPKKSTKNTAVSSKVPSRQYSREEVLAFCLGIRNLTDWTSTRLPKEATDTIRWYDKEDLAMTKCCEHYAKTHAKSGTCSDKYLSRKYNEWAPQFYLEKNMSFVPPQQRPKNSKKKFTTSTLTKDVISNVDVDSRLTPPEVSEEAHENWVAWSREAETAKKAEKAIRARRWQIQHAFAKKAKEARMKRDPELFDRQKAAEEQIQNTLESLYATDGEQDSALGDLDSCHDSSEFDDVDDHGSLPMLPNNIGETDGKVRSVHFTNSVGKRNLFDNDDEALNQSAIVGKNYGNQPTLLGSPAAQWAEHFSILYPGQGMNTTKDSRETTERKMVFVRVQLDLFRQYYNVDDEEFAVTRNTNSDGDDCES